MTEDCSLRVERGGAGRGPCSESRPSALGPQGLSPVTSRSTEAAPPGSPGLSGAVCAKLGHTSSDGVPAASRIALRSWWHLPRFLPPEGGPAAVTCPWSELPLSRRLTELTARPPPALPSVSTYAAGEGWALRAPENEAESRTGQHGAWLPSPRARTGRKEGHVELRPSE